MIVAHNYDVFLFAKNVIYQLPVFAYNSPGTSVSQYCEYWYEEKGEIELVNILCVQDAFLPNVTFVEKII